MHCGTLAELVTTAAVDNNNSVAVATMATISTAGDNHRGNNDHITIPGITDHHGSKAGHSSRWRWGQPSPSATTPDGCGDSCSNKQPYRPAVLADCWGKTGGPTIDVSGSIGNHTEVDTRVGPTLTSHTALHRLAAGTSFWGPPRPTTTGQSQYRRWEPGDAVGAE